MPDIIRKRHSKRPLLQAELEVAMKNSKSNKGAARFLGVDYMEFSKKDCVRSGIVSRVLEKYNYNGDSIELP